MTPSKQSSPYERATNPERQLLASARQYNRRAQSLEEATVERDEAIRKARAAGISQARVMEITGLSRPRINQITRNARL